MAANNKTAARLLYFLRSSFVWARGARRHRAPQSGEGLSRIRWQWIWPIN